MFGRKKNRLGFHPKKRTLDEINRDYQEHAWQVGHKMRIIAEVQAEVDQHVAHMLAINDEAKKLPKEEPKPAAPAPAPAAEKKESA